VRRFLASVYLAFALLFAGRVAIAQPKPKPQPPKKEQPQPKNANDATYDRHMSIGVSLFRAGDFKAALAEFEAAYEAVPKASPLINQALCYRQLNRFTKAVARLELALSRHGAEMSDADKAEATRAIDEMRAVFGFVTIRIKPDTATVRIDDEDIATDALKGKIALTPGEHAVEVSARGHVTKTEKVRVVSGSDQTLEFDLALSTGILKVVAAKKTTPIEVDGTIMGTGTWQGPLGAGPHDVRAVGESGVGRVEIAAGTTVVLDLSVDSGISPLPPVPKPDAPKKKAPDPEVKRGFYGTVNGGILFPFKHPQFFDQPFEGNKVLDGLSSGGYVGLRPGYRVHTYAGFEGLLEYGNVQGPANGTEEKSYSLTSIHFGPVLRVMSPGEIIRFVGTLGGGFAVHLMSYDGVTAAEACPGVQSADCSSSSGVDFLAMTEAGFEVDIDRVLIGLTLAFYLSGTKGMNDFDKNSELVNDRIAEPYENGVLPMMGPRIHIGYGFW
jgi:hypothetical protein